MSWRSFGIVGATVAFVSQTAFAQAPPPPPPPPPLPTTEPPKEAPKEAPKETPKEAPKETPKEAPKETPKEAPKERPADWVDAKPGEDKPAKPDEKDPNKPQTPEDQFGTEDDGKPAEKKATSRYFLGARFRDFVAPNFIFGLFADGGPDVVNVFSGGPEFMLNTGALEVIFSVTVPYADYSMDEFLFKAKSDPERAFEFASSSLKLITASVDLLGRIPIDDKGTVAFLIGGGVGISGVLGDIYRNQAYPVNPDDADPSDVTKWRKCKAPGDGNQAPDGGDYCGTDNDHYGEYSEPSWSDGGSKPIVFPYIALPHLALEVTPVEEFMVRLDTGFSITGFFFGLGGGGRLPI